MRHGTTSRHECVGACCRFDCLCVVKDQVDPQMDERLAKFVVQSHHHSHPSNQMDELQRAAAGEAAAVAPPGATANAIDQGLLRLYIAYAKKNCHPKLQDADTAKMVQVRQPGAACGQLPGVSGAEFSAALCDACVLCPFADWRGVLRKPGR